MNRVKVAVVLHGLGANGIDTLFANLSEIWDKERYDIKYFLAVNEDAKQFWEDKVIASGVNVIHITDLDGKALYKWPVNLYKYLKKYGPFDAIHVNMDMLNGINLLVARLAKIKIRVCHSHTSSNKTETRFAKKLIKNIYLIIMKMLIHINATQKIACSDVSGEYFYGKSKYKTIYNGIDISMYSANNKEKSIQPVFVTVGRMSEPKNPQFLVEIIKEIFDKKPQAKMLWVGNGELRFEIENKVKALGISEKVEFLGIRNDVNEILKHADYFLLPSLYEGLSIALAEAQAAGLDCFVSDTVSELSDCGKLKFISLNKTATAWADEIIKFIDSNDVMTIDHNKLAKFDIRHMAKELELIYAGKTNGRK